MYYIKANRPVSAGIEKVNQTIQSVGFVPVIRKPFNSVSRDIPEDEIHSDKIRRKVLVAVWDEFTKNKCFDVHGFAHLQNNKLQEAKLTKSEREYLNRKGALQREFCDYL
jgi:hypothetical protein